MLTDNVRDEWSYVNIYIKLFIRKCPCSQNMSQLKIHVPNSDSSFKDINIQQHYGKSKSKRLLSTTYRW